MPSDNIREWGRTNGFEVPEEGRLPPGLRSAFDARIRDDETAVDAAPEVTDNDERPPALVKPTTVERVRGMAARAKAANAPVRGARSSKARKPRVSTEKALSWLWSGAASLANSFNPAVSRVMSMQAPMAGMILEDKVKNTIADKVLQPIARGLDSGNTAMALIGPPLFIQALTMRPERAPQIVPMLRASLRSWVVVAGSKIEAQVEEDKEFEEKYGKKIDEMLEYILEPLGFQMNRPEE